MHAYNLPACLLFTSMHINVLWSDAYKMFKQPFAFSLPFCPCNDCNAAPSCRKITFIHCAETVFKEKRNVWADLAGFKSHKMALNLGSVIISKRRKYQTFLTYRFWSRLTIPVALWSIPGSIVAARGSQRDVVYLGWPISPSYMSPNAGGGLRCLSQWVKLCTSWSSNKLTRSLTQYLTYSIWLRKIHVHKGVIII